MNVYVFVYQYISLILICEVGNRDPMVTFGFWQLVKTSRSVARSNTFHDATVMILKCNDVYLEFSITITMQLLAVYWYCFLLCVGGTFRTVNTIFSTTQDTRQVGFHCFFHRAANRNYILVFIYVIRKPFNPIFNITIRGLHLRNVRLLCLQHIWHEKQICTVWIIC